MADISKIVLPDGNEYDIKDATARQSGDGLNARLRGETEIPANSDLNDYITPGEYYCHISPQNRSITNYPINLAFRLRVEYSFHPNVSSGDVRQTFVPYNRSYCYVRTREQVNGAYIWNDWEKISSNVQADWSESDTTADSYIQNKPNPYLLETFIPIMDGDDLDDYTTPGEYYVSSSSVSVLNSPVSPTAFRLRVEYFPTATFIKQTWSIRIVNVSLNPLTYVRFYNGDTQTWGSWRYDDDGFYARLLGDINIPANSDLNTYVTPGEYKCHLNATAQTITNAPTSSIAFRLRVEYGTHEDSRYIRQVFTPYSHRFPYIRVSIDSGSTWNAWVREGNESNIGMVKLSDTYSSAVSGADAAGGVAASQNALYNVYDYATGKANSCSPNLKFRLGTNSDTADDNPHVELRESGTLGTNRRLSLIYYDANGTTSSISLVNENGAFLPAFPPKSHASTATTYGQGNASNYGHVKLSDTYSSSVSGANAAGGVGASQNALYNAYNAITSGSVAAGKASSLVPTSSAAFETDAYGNFNHKRTTATDDWSINANDGTEKLRVFYETGKLIAGGRIVVHAPGDNVSIADYITTGFITSSQTRLSFSVPAILTTGVTAASCTSLSVTVRHIGGNYPYMCYGSSNNTYEQLGSSRVSIWANSKTVRTNGVSNIDVSVRDQFLSVYVDFKNTLRTNAGTTVVTNNTPVALHVTGVFKLS